MRGLASKTGEEAAQTGCGGLSSRSATPSAPPLAAPVSVLREPSALSALKPRPAAGRPPCASPKRALGAEHDFPQVGVRLRPRGHARCAEGSLDALFSAEDADSPQKTRRASAGSGACGAWRARSERSGLGRIRGPVVPKRDAVCPAASGSGERSPRALCALRAETKACSRPTALRLAQARARSGARLPSGRRQTSPARTRSVCRGLARRAF